MVRVVIYGEKPTDIEGLEKMLREILTENRRWPMIHTYISDLDAYLHFVKGNPYLIMLASVQGRLESWRIHVTTFGLFQKKKEELEELLAACSESLLDRKKKYFVQVGNRLK